MCSFSRFFIVLMILVGTIGCSRQNLPDDLPELVSCKLTITQDGKPLADAKVILESTDETSKWFPGGTTNQNGMVVLLTNGRYKGAPHGTYKVTVQKTETEPSKLGPEPPHSSPEYAKWVFDAGMEKRTSYILVEEKYSKPQTTPHELEVAGKKTITATFDVGKEIREKMLKIDPKERR